MLNKVQEELKSIITDFDEFCKKNELQYYLMGGSALGAARHGGFIPWDDDMDVFMDFENYHRFLSLYADNSKYTLQKEDSEEWPLFLSQLRKNNTTFISDDFRNNKKMHHGIFIDIMCLYSAPTSVVKRKVQYFYAMLLKINALDKVGYPQSMLIKKIAMKLSRLVVNPLTKPFIISQVRKYEGKEEEYVAHYFGRARFSKTSFHRTVLGKPTYTTFENILLPVMENNNEYLEVRYGAKYMEMPDQKTLDMYPIHGNFVDLEKDYREYI